MRNGRRALSAGATFILTFFIAACSGGASGREIDIVATDSGCTPVNITATAGEKLTFLMKNEAKGDRELEGVEGTRLEEVLVPAGRTRKINYTAPKQQGTQKLKCYVPGGPSTLIELRVTSS
jgi:hypothetical protein